MEIVRGGTLCKLIFYFRTTYS